MTITSNAITPIFNSGLLTALRSLGREPASSIEELRRIAAAQATTLRQALPESVHQLPAYITTLIPSIVVEYVARLPVAGLSYWADHHWHIHVRQEDSAETQLFTMLHQLKRIIDHPLRRPNGFADKDCDELANYFAYQVLTHDGISPPTKKVKCPDSGKRTV